METEFLRRYALALALVPDPDAAGDLFMDAASEAELRRRVGAWRQKHGFPELTADPPLPALSPDAREYALHLARRGLQRRRMRVVWRAGAILLLLMLVTVGGTVVTRGTLAPPLPAWASDPVFSGSAPGQQTVNQVTFRVFKSQATPGLLEVWWSASGPGTLKAWQSLAPVASLTTATGELATSPLRTETVRVGREEVRGHGTFRVVTAGARMLVMQLDKAGDRQVGAKVWTAIGWRSLEDPEAVTYPLPKPPDGWLNVFTPTTIKVAPGYAAVLYDNPFLLPEDVRACQLVAGDLALRYLGWENISDRVSVEYFEAPQAGTASLTVLARTGWYRRQNYQVDLPGSIGGVHLAQQGSDPVVVVTDTGNSTVSFGLPGYVEDEHGKSYTLFPAANQINTDLILQVQGMPTGTHLVRATFLGVETAEDPRLSVQLKPNP